MLSIYFELKQICFVSLTDYYKNDYNEQSLLASDRQSLGVFNTVKNMVSALWLEHQSNIGPNLIYIFFRVCHLEQVVILKPNISNNSNNEH